MTTTTKRKSAVLLAGALAAGALLSGCAQKADVVSKNLSTAADNYQIARKITFYNGITGRDIVTVTGFCSVDNNDPSGEVGFTCKTDDGSFIKDMMGLSDNTTWVAEQLSGAEVSTTHYSVVWTPQQIIPNVTVK